MKKFFIFLITAEIIFIAYLARLIYQKMNNVLGAINVNPINKNSLIFSETKDLKYFYEPAPNTIDKVNEWSPYQGVYTINSDSLNERYEYSIEKPEKTFRIITLGDSFTYGLYVDTKDNWPEKLEDMLNSNLKCKNFNKFEVINLAVQGYDIQYNVERFLKRGVKYDPDLVIWYIVDPLRITDRIIPLSLQIKKHLEERGDLEKLKGYYIWTNASKKILDEFGEENILNFQKENFLQFKTLYNGPIVFIYETGIKNFFEGFLRENYKKGWFLTITLLEENKFPTDDHPNQKGHQKIAQEVFDFIIKKNLFSCY